MTDPGFAVIPDLINASELNAIALELEQSALKRSRAGIRHALSVPAVAELARDRRLLAVAAEELRCEPLPFGATLFDKSSEANWLVVWHQDTSLPLRERREVAGWGPWSDKDGVTYAHAPADALSQVVALRVHLDDSTENNGPLRVLPGSHASGVLNDAQIQEKVRSVKPVSCTVGRGGVVLMRPLLVHSSSKAVTSALRRVLHLEYAKSPIFDGGLRLHLPL